MTLFSEEAETCEECLAQEFTIDHGAIRDPGKFEAESLATYHAYHFLMDGFSDDEVDGVVRVGNVLIEESEHGFVYGTVCDDEQEAIALLTQIEKRMIDEQETEEEE